MADGEDGRETSRVNMERLKEMSDGTEEGVRELAQVYLKQTSELLGKIERAAQDGRTGEVRMLAHKCIGSSAFCGMRTMVSLFENLEKAGEGNRLDEAQRLAGEAKRELELVKQQLPISWGRRP